MSEDLNKNLNKGKELLKEMRDETGLLYDALTSIGTNIGDSISELIDGATELDDIGRTIANTYGKEIENSLKKSAKGLEGNIKLQIKINSGKNASKDIERAIASNLARKEVTLMHIENLHKNTGTLTAEQAHLQAKLTNEAINTFNANETLLGNLSDQNIETQRGISLYKLASNAFGNFANKIDKSGTLSKILAGNFKETFSIARFGQATVASLVTFMIKAIVEIDKLQTGLNRQFGFTGSTARIIQERFEGIAAASENTLLTFRDIHKAADAITEATGIFAGTLRSEVLDGAAQTLEFMGLTGDAVARLALNAQTTGQAYNDQMLSMADGLIIAEQTVGVTLDGKKAFQEAAKATGLIRANLGRNYETIVNTVGQAQALGLTLQDLASISSNLLNFQSSIENELAAELFTGKQLNLEKARLYALTGDYNNLQKEVMKNVGSEYEFLSMNVLQKEKYAAALGMSVDKMSNLVMKNADLAAIEQQAREGGRQDIVDEMQKLTMAKSMQKLTEKLQTSFVAMAPGLGALADMFTNILGSTEALYGVLGLIVGIKIAGLVASIWSMVAANKAAAVSGAVMNAAINPYYAVAGVAAAIIAGVAIGNSIDTETAKAPKVGSFKNLPRGKFINVDQGEARIHAGEFSGHMSDVEENNPLLQRIENAILGLNLSVNLKTPTKYV